MKAEKLIKNNSLSTKDLPYVVNQDGKDQEVVFKEVALTAVNMARKEEKELACKALESVLDNVAPSLSDYILEEFEEKLNK